MPKRRDGRHSTPRRRRPLRRTGRSRSTAVPPLPDAHRHLRRVLPGLRSIRSRRSQRADPEQTGIRRANSTHGPGPTTAVPILHTARCRPGSRCHPAGGRLQAPLAQRQRLRLPIISALLRCLPIWIARRISYWPRWRRSQHPTWMSRRTVRRSVNSWSRTQRTRHTTQVNSKYSARGWENERMLSGLFNSA